MVCLDWGEGKGMNVNEHLFPLFGNIKWRGMDGNISPSFTPIALNFIHPQNERERRGGKDFNSSPPSPSISTHNISKHGEYKSPCFPSLYSVAFPYLLQSKVH